MSRPVFFAPEVAQTLGLAAPNPHRNPSDPQHNPSDPQHNPSDPQHFAPAAAPSAEQLASIAGREFEVSGTQAHHAVTVTRLRAGEEADFIDGAGWRITAVITEVVAKDRLLAAVRAVGYEPAASPWVTVIQAIPKGDAGELAVDLATQSGADEIIAWSAARSIARWDAKKAPKALAKWQSAALAAAKQSRRSWVPQLSGPLSTAQLRQYLAPYRDDPSVQILVLHESAQHSLKSVELSGSHLILIIGPEGGISDEELELLGGQPVVLGPQVLRSATAAMVALAAIGVRTERW